MGFGGAGWGGGGGGGVGGGPRGGQGPGQAAGLPFAGIPPEMMGSVQKLLGKEPEHPEPEVAFSHVTPEVRRFTLARFLRPHWLAIAIGVAMVAVETISLNAGPLLTQRGIDDGIAKGNFRVILVTGLIYVASVFVNGVSTWGRTSWTGRLGQRLMKTLRVRVFSHLQRLSLDYFTDEKAGRIMTRMTSDVEALQELLGQGIIQFVVQGFTLIIVVTALFLMNVQLAMVVLFGIVPVMFLMTLWFRNASEREYENVRNRIADLLADLQENLSGIRIITAYNRQRFNEAKHRNYIGDHQVANDKAAQIAAVYGPGADAVGTLAQMLVLVVGGWMVLRGNLTVGELTAFILYLNSFFAPIQQLVQLYNSYQKGQAAIHKLADLFETTPTVEEKHNATELPPIVGEITLENVTFGYRPEEPVLRDVDLTIRAGETFSLVGQTGAGKSTIAKLVTRFYDPTDGTVRVDGYDVRDVTIDSLRRQLGIVPQEPFLFGGTIRDNVSFARPDASDDEVMEACRAAGLDDLVERLPEGIDTPVYERGSSLSSGERQLLALARAFLAQPRVLVLDEATSSLDLKSEAIIERALDNVLEGRTAIIIAHRLSTAMRADRIAVVNDGRIVELGSHDELVELGGIYAGMFAQWMEHMGDDVLTSNVQP